MVDTQSLDQSCSISQKATKKLPLQNSILDESDLMHMSGVENDQESMNAEMEADEVIDRENERFQIWI